MLKTKIIATLGPASDSKRTIEKLIKSGVSCFRFNLKHSSLDWHNQRIQRVLEVCKKIKKYTAIYIDLQGPEVRIGNLPKGKMKLKKGEKIALAKKEIKGYKTIPMPRSRVLLKLKKGQTIYLDDAFLELKVLKNHKSYVLAKVVEGGVLTSRKGANFPDLELDLPTLVEKDLKALSLAQKSEVDYVGLSFVRGAKDIKNLRKELIKRKINPGIIAKIETKQAVKNFESIAKEADAVMIARGDLAVEFPYQKVPFIQKEIIGCCRMNAKPVIVATQMLQSMTQNPRPTRAEISDVANAVYEAADCLMLSGETASGKYPVKAVTTMADIAGFIEDKRQKEVFQVGCDDLDEVITEAVYKISQSDFAHCKHVDKLVVLTQTGKTARLISRFRSDLEIIAVCSTKEISDKLKISYGINPFYYKFPKGEITSTKKIIDFLKEKKALEKGERILLTHGKVWGKPGRTNTIRIEKVK